MNKEALIRTRDAVAASQTYDQSMFTCLVNEGAGIDNICRTPACVAGHAVVANGYTFIDGYECQSENMSHFGAISVIAKNILGLTEDEEYLMFTAKPFEHDRSYETTKKDALRMLDNAIEHDEVDWMPGYDY